MKPVYTHERTVAWGECDPFGLVYYPHITAWMNDAEHEYLRSIDLSIDDMIAADSTTFVMGEMDFRFLGPALNGQRISASLFLERMGASTVFWRCEIENLTTDAAVAVGKATRIYARVYEDKSLKARPIPDLMRERLRGAGALPQAS